MKNKNNIESTINIIGVVAIGIFIVIAIALVSVEAQDLIVRLFCK